MLDVVGGLLLGGGGSHTPPPRTHPNLRGPCSAQCPPPPRTAVCCRPGLSRPLRGPRLSEHLLLCAGGRGWGVGGEQPDPLPGPRRPPALSAGQRDGFLRGTAPPPRPGSAADTARRPPGPPPGGVPPNTHTNSPTHRHCPTHATGAEAAPCTPQDSPPKKGEATAACHPPPPSPPLWCQEGCSRSGPGGGGCTQSPEWGLEAQHPLHPLLQRPHPQRGGRDPPALIRMSYEDGGGPTPVGAGGSRSTQPKRKPRI